MRILIVHNEHGKFSGEEAVVKELVGLLHGRGHEVAKFMRSSSEINTMRLGQLRAFFGGIYSISSRRRMRRLLAEFRPDVVHIHNLFPLISPSILLECRQAEVPVVMSVHNYRLVCPNGLHMPKGSYTICERCCGGREYWCILQNCEQNWCKSIGYALRSYIARRWGFFQKNVNLFACLTDFQRRRLIAEGFTAERLWVLPNMCPTGEVSEASSGSGGRFAAYVGRISPEKGISVLIAAAKLLPDIPICLAGSYDTRHQLLDKIPTNVKVLGVLDQGALAGFYRESRFLLVSSICFEGFPMTILEAMGHSRAVIAPRVGGIPEIVDDGINGLLFEPGEVEDLADKVRYLWGRPGLCSQMGRAGRQKVLQEYSSEKHYERLMTLYLEATANAGDESLRTIRAADPAGI